LPDINTYARVAFFLSIVKVPHHITSLAMHSGHIVVLRLDFLHAQNTSALLGNPVEKTFAGRRANPV
jgi:hypothetical protein